MSLVLERWSIDRWPMRAIVSLYLLTTAAVVAGEAWLAAGALHSASDVAGLVAVKTFGVVVPAAQAGRAASALQLLGVGFGFVFTVATILMWTHRKGRRIAAASAALLAGAAWWALALATITQPAPPALAPSAVLIALTAVVTAGVLAATLRRATSDGAVVDQAGAADANGGEHARRPADRPRP